VARRCRFLRSWRLDRRKWPAPVLNTPLSGRGPCGQWTQTSSLMSPSPSHSRDDPVELGHALVMPPLSVRYRKGPEGFCALERLGGREVAGAGCVGSGGCFIDAPMTIRERRGGSFHPAREGVWDGAGVSKERRGPGQAQRDVGTLGARSTDREVVLCREEEGDLARTGEGRSWPDPDHRRLPSNQRGSPKCRVVAPQVVRSAFSPSAAHPRFPILFSSSAQRLDPNPYFPITISRVDNTPDEP